MNSTPKALKKPTSGRYAWHSVSKSDPVYARYFPNGTSMQNWVSGFNAGSDMWYKYGRALGFCQGLTIACTVIVGGELVGMVINDIHKKHEHDKRVRELLAQTVERRDIRMRAHEPHRAGDKDPTYFQAVKEREDSQK